MQYKCCEALDFHSCGANFGSRPCAVWVQIKLANREAPITVTSPATAIARLLMAPSTSPISMALAVPIAWEAVPSASPFAIGSSMRNSLNTNSAMTFPRIPVTIMTATVIVGDAQADGGGDGFGEQRHILFVIKAEQLCQQENAHKAGQDAGGDAAGHGFYIILKQGELPVKRHGKAYGGRREQIADIARAFAVVAVFHMQKRQYCHDADCSDQQWI